MKRTGTLLMWLLAIPVAVVGQQDDRGISIGAVDSIWSDALGEQRRLLVYTPPSYHDTTATPQRYPVLYLLDGDAHFHSVTGLVQILSTGVNYTFAIPQMIVVAIPNTNRLRDLTPTRPRLGGNGEPYPPDVEVGGNDALFDFLEQELIPHIDARYRTMDYRVFVGHSLGGITAINALYQRPEMFDAYVAIDPSLWWDEELLVRRARDYFLSADLDRKALYVAQANTVNADDLESMNHITAITRFDAVVDAYDASGMRYGFRYYDGDDHGSVAFIATYDALRFIFDGYRLPVTRLLGQPELLTEHFRRVSERLGTSFTPSEPLIRLLANGALGRDLENAVAFGELRVELYPDSYGAYEFLGSVWASRNEPARAAEYYREALERAPGNERIREKLRALGG